MREHRFGWTGVGLPVIGQGTWNMERDSRGEVVRAIRRGLDAGMTHIDTAEMYGSGRVEELLREALAGRRDEVFLVSKVLPSNASHDGTLAACERSLKRLGTDRLDCYLLHWSGTHPLEETIAAFEKLVEDGKIRYWGVSNFDEGELEDVLRIAGPGRCACNQVLLHLGARWAEAHLLDRCREHDIALVAYSPLGCGDFPEPYTPGGGVLGRIAAAHEVSPYQVALAFLTRDPMVLAIPKASQTAHVDENAAAGALMLTDDEVAELERAFPVDARGGIPML